MDNPASIVTPVIDIISDDTFRYISHKLALGIGIFTFNLEFKWKTIVRSPKAFPGMKKTEPVRCVHFINPF